MLVIEVPTVQEFQTLQARVQSLESLVEKLLQGTRKQEFYNPKEAAAFLNVSVPTVRRLLDRGLLEKSLGIRHIRIPRQSLESYLDKTT